MFCAKKQLDRLPEPFHVGRKNNDGITAKSYSCADTVIDRFQFHNLVLCYPVIVHYATLARRTPDNSIFWLVRSGHKMAVLPRET